MKLVKSVLVLLLIINSSSISFCAGSDNTKPWSYWWWPGSAVDKQNITYNLELFSEAGIGGVHIIPIYGVKGYEDKFINFLSEDWMKMFEYTASECSRLGLGLDMTLGTGWPYGGPNVDVSHASSKIIGLQYEIKSGNEVSFNVFDEAGKKTNKEYSLSLLALNVYNDSSVYNLTGNVQPAGEFKFKALDDCRLIALVLVSGVQKVKRAAPGGEGYTSDPFSAEAMHSYLSVFDSEFASHNKLLPRSFYHDSYEYYNADWTKNFLDEFLKRRKYDLVEKLPELFSGDSSDVICRIRSDYRQTIAELHEEYLFTVSGWAHSHGALFRNQAHGSPSNLSDTYAAADIPETEVFGSPRLNIPGIKEEEKDYTRQEFIDPLILKFASSAAHVTGKNIISSETGTWLTEHFRETPALVKPEVDLLFLSGINHIFYHGITYSPKNEEWPGWQFYAASDFGPAGTYWYNIKAINNYIEQCQQMLRSGNPCNDVLLYFPVWDTWYSGKKGLINFEMHNPESWLFNTEFYKAASGLTESGYSFDYISDKQLQNVKVNNGAIETGNSSYRAVVVPSCRFIPVETLRVLYDILKSGGRVIFVGGIPPDVPGYYNYEKRKEELKVITTNILQINKAGIISGNIHQLQDLLGKAGIKKEYLSEYGLSYIRRKTGTGIKYFVVNNHNKKINGWVKLAYNAESVTAFTPVNGETGDAKIKSSPDGYTLVYLQIQPGESIILDATEKKNSLKPWIYLNKTGKAFKINDTWNLEFIQGGPAIPAGRKIEKPGLWTKIDDPDIQRFAGTARYTCTFINPDPTVKNWILDLGSVCESAGVTINGVSLGTLWAYPYNMKLKNILVPGANKIEIEVTNSSANRIRDLDLKGVQWKKFYDINFVNINYKQFDASSWELRDSGLEGPVVLYEAEEICN